MLYKLTDPALNKKKKESGIYWNRYQTETDRSIFRICNALKRGGHLVSTLIDKNHVTNAILGEGSTPWAIWDHKSLFSLFKDSPSALSVISKHVDVGDDVTPGGKSAAPAKSPYAPGYVYDAVSSDDE